MAAPVPAPAAAASKAGGARPLDILFVDDEPRILDGLRRALHGKRDAWTMRFAGSGPEALALLESAPCDIVISDMRMPGMDGAALLGHVKERHPEALRFVLSGHAELEAVMRVVQVAHQFLTKPCPADELCDSVERAVALKALLTTPRLLAVVGSMSALPPSPAAYTAVVAAVADPDVGIRDVAAIIEQDATVAANLLHLANSGFFANRHAPITTVIEAVKRIGLFNVRDLVLALGVYRPPAGTAHAVAAFLARIQAHVFRVAHLSQAIMEPHPLAAQAFTAGLLHDIGKVLLVTREPERYLELLARARAAARPEHDVETEELGVSHAEVGASLLGYWGLPYPLLEAVAHHHRAPETLASALDLPLAVHAADVLVSAREAHHPTTSELDADRLRAAGVLERVPEWERLADQVMA